MQKEISIEVVGEAYSRNLIFDFVDSVERFGSERRPGECESDRSVSDSLKCLVEYPTPERTLIPTGIIARQTMLKYGEYIRCPEPVGKLGSRCLLRGAAACGGGKACLIGFISMTTPDEKQIATGIIGGRKGPFDNIGHMRVSVLCFASVPLGQSGIRYLIVGQNHLDFLICRQPPVERPQLTYELEFTSILPSVKLLLPENSE